MPGGGSPASGFDLDGAWRVHPRVALRPESFGALAYHYGTRRLSFLKSPQLLQVLSTLEVQSSARAACLQAGVTDQELGHYARALATLADTDMIEPRPA